jgi:hypothetical protein
MIHTIISCWILVNKKQMHLLKKELRNIKKRMENHILIFKCQLNNRLLKILRQF